MKKWILSLALTSIAGSALADPLTDAIAEDGGTACFTRSYDAAWLKAHPGQTVREVRMAFTLDREDQSWTAFRMMLRGAGQPLYLFGGCGWAEPVNRGVDNNILDPTFKPESGVGCHMMTDVTGASAEEGGDFPVDWQSSQVIQAHLPECVAAWRSYDISRNAKFVDVRSGRPDRPAQPRAVITMPRAGGEVRPRATRLLNWAKWCGAGRSNAHGASAGLEISRGFRAPPHKRRGRTADCG